MLGNLQINSLSEIQTKLQQRARQRSKIVRVFAREGLSYTILLYHMFYGICQFYLNQEIIDWLLVYQGNTHQVHVQFFDVVHRLHVLQLYGQFPLLLSFSYYGSILFYLVVKNILFDDIKLFLIFANRFLQAIISTLLTVEINASLFCSTTL